MIHETLPVGLLGCNCSVIGDEMSREAIVIDPGDDVAKIITILRRHNLMVKMIVITHAHIDHIGGAEHLRAFTGAPVYMHEADKMLSGQLDVQAAWLGMETPKDPGIDQPAHEGDILRAGSIEAHVLHTPATPKAAFRSICRTKANSSRANAVRGQHRAHRSPGGDTEQIKQSIRGKLYTLPEDDRISRPR